MNKRILASVMVLLSFSLLYTFSSSFKSPRCFTEWTEPASCLGEKANQIEYKITGTYPHAPDAFTQGLFYENGFLYESTGQYGASTLRKVKLETGEVLQKIHLPFNIFGEGISLYRDRIIQLTWHASIIFIYDRASLSLIDKIKMPHMIEGWGLTYDGTHLVLSDGSSRLYFLDPSNFAVIKKISVHTEKGPVRNINELEFIDNSIYANVWLSDTIVIINPTTGKVTDFIDLSALRPETSRKRPNQVLNGIAFNPQNGRIFVTGKMWPQLYELELIPRIFKAGRR